MPDFCTLVNDQGHEASLALQSPGMLKQMLRAAVFRRLEEDIGVKVGFRHRACLDVVARHLASKKFLPGKRCPQD
eukprot:1792166-Pyramimonas_sp.AAC.1